MARNLSKYFLLALIGLSPFNSVTYAQGTGPGGGTTGGGTTGGGTTGGGTTGGGTTGGGGSGGIIAGGTLSFVNGDVCYANGSAENRQDPTDAAIMFGNLQLASHEKVTPWSFPVAPGIFNNPRLHESRAKRTGPSTDDEAIGLAKLQCTVMGEFRSRSGAGVSQNPQTVTASTGLRLAQSGGGIIRKYYYICGRYAWQGESIQKAAGSWPGFPEPGYTIAPFFTQLSCGSFRFEWENRSGGGDGRTLRIMWNHMNMSWYSEQDRNRITNPDVIVIIDDYVDPKIQITMSAYERSTSPYLAPYGGREVCGVVWAEWVPLGTPLPETGMTVIPPPNVGPTHPPFPAQVAIKHYPNLIKWPGVPVDALKARERNVGIYYLPPGSPQPNPPYPSYVSGLITRHRGTLYTP